MKKKFILDFKLGLVTFDDIDDYVGEWHESNSELTLGEYLGFNKQQMFEFIRTGCVKYLNMGKIYENDLKVGDKVLLEDRVGLVIGKTSRKITVKMPDSRFEITEFKKGILLKYLGIEFIESL